MLLGLDIPAIEKLMYLMEGNVRQSILSEEKSKGGTTQAIKARAAARQAEYDKTYGSLVETIQAQMYKELTAGFRQNAQLIPGYSEDMGRVISSYKNWTAGHVAESMYTNPISRAYKDFGEHPSDIMKSYVKAWYDYNNDPTSTWGKLGQSATKLGFTMSMAANPSSMLPIMMHTPLFGWTALHIGQGFGGVSRATAAFTKAMTEAYGASRADTKNGLHIDVTRLGKNAAEKAYLQRMDAAGMLHPLGAEDLAAMFDSQKNLWQKNWPVMNRIYKVLGSNISYVDQANRATLALASFRLAQDAGFRNNVMKAFKNDETLKDMVKRNGATPDTIAQFLHRQGAMSWGKMNQAPMMRSAGQAVFLLHGFQTRALSRMWEYSSKLGPEGRMALTYMAAPLLLGAGMSGLPFVQDVGNLADTAYQFFTKKDPMIGYRVHQMISDAGFGKVGSELITQGAGSLLGVDTTDRLGFGKVLSEEVQNPVNLVGTLPSMIWEKINAATKRAQSKQGFAASASEVLPAFARGPAQAYVYGQNGVKSQPGRQELSKNKISAGDIAARALGFTPTDVLRAQEHAKYNYRATHAKMRAPRDVTP